MHLDLTMPQKRENKVFLGKQAASTVFVFRWENA